MSDALAQAIGRLNPEQAQAVAATRGPVLVLAGAGSGKTRVITVRGAKLIAEGLRPSGLLCVTFTNKAAEEMRERLKALLPKGSMGGAEPPFIGTFHSFCLSLLREHGQLLGLGERIHLCDAADQITGIRGALREAGVNDLAVKPRAIQGQVSLLKNKLISPDTARRAARDGAEELLADVYEAYQDWLGRSRLLDFDDLLTRGVELLRTQDAVRELVQQRFEYIQVDEYQDTNLVQYELLRALAGRDGNLCAVGDDDQSIYAWRGADVTKILSFERDFEGAQVIVLDRNYRSTPQILEAANKVVAHNPDRHAKELKSQLPGGHPVQAFTAPEETSEADHVALQIQDRVRRKEALWGDFAILFRTTTQPRAFEEQLRTRGIPYVLIGGQSFFDRKEIRDLLAYLKAAANPDDEASLLRILNCPPRGVGKTSVERALAFATAQRISVGAAFDRGEEVEKLGPKAMNAARDLRRALATWRERATPERLPEAIEELLELVGYQDELERAYKDEAVRAKRAATLNDLVEMARRHVDRRKRPSLNKFLDELTLSTSDSDDKESKLDRDAVVLMTLHAAKGLEFREVFLVGFEEGILPHARSVQEDNVDEERRLAYVGMTRARERLVISWCAQRRRGGGMGQVHVSRFWWELKGEDPPEDWKASGGPPTEAERKERAKRARRFAKKR
jgi:DNA helicase-2/ATP-dependent DNA helicase PcrA